MEDEREYPVEHPAEFRVDARMGSFTITQVISSSVLTVILLVAELVLVMARSSTWKIVVLPMFIVALVAEIMFKVVRKINRAVNFGLRPRWRRADASRKSTAASDATVQDLMRVEGCTGPFVHFMDGYVAMVLRVAPAPTNSLSSLQKETLRARWQNALKRAFEAKLEVVTYDDVEPDLNRPELDRIARLGERWAAGSGIRMLADARVEHHRWLAETTGRRVSCHLRLSINPADVPLPRRPVDAQDHMEQIISYLRDKGMGIAAELSSVGLKVQPLGPEGIRDLAARQLDPDGHRLSEPARGTDWSWPVGGAPGKLQAAEDAQRVDLPLIAVVETVAAPLVPEAEPDEPDDPVWLFDQAPPVIPVEPPCPVATAPVHVAQEPPAPLAQPVFEQESSGRSAEDLWPLPAAAVEEEDHIEVELAAQAVPVPAAAPAAPAQRTASPWWQVGRRSRTQPLPTATPMKSREVLAVIGADRKAGTSTVAASLALALRGRGNSVSLICLDGGRNDIITWTGIHAIVSNHDWVQSSDELLLPGPRGTTLVPGPSRLPGSPYQPLDTEAVTRVLGRVRRDSDLVVLDLGADVTQEQRAALMQATGALVVTTPDPDCWAAAQDRIAMATAQGLANHSVALVLNRATSDRPPGQVELMLPEDECIPECRRVGSIPVIGAPESIWAQNLTKWAYKL